jgi:AcrR family transcriptional regulator
MDDTAETMADGRNARRERNRVAALDAAIELFGEGTAPSPEAIARKSGLSLSSIYRYFDDIEALQLAAIGRGVERNQALLQIPGIGEGPLEDRIARFVDARIAFFEHAAPVLRAVVHASHTNEALAEQYRIGREAVYADTQRHFDAELRTMSASQRVWVSATIDVLFQVESFDHLNTRLGHSPTVLRAIMREALTAVLRSPA